MKSTTNSSPPRDWTQSRGFTILEVLIAITLSLVLMLSLTRAFKFLADQIRENRVRVELSNRAQNVNQILQDDLRNMTVKLTPRDANSEDEGYFVYYEGPGTDVTSVMLGTQVATLDPSPYFQDSRFGDFDDYLAFTVYNPETPFRGVVPKYLLLEKQDETDDGVGDTIFNDYDIRNLTNAQLQDALEPVVIYSHYAEIIYWLEPEHVTQDSVDGLGNSALSYTYDGLGNVNIRDADQGIDRNNNETGDGYPDRLTLHRRVLLIRPDLNLTASPASPINPGTAVFPGTLPQLSFPTSQGNYVFMQPDPWPSDATANPLPRIIRTGGEGNDQRNRSWQIGMAPIHQQCDLSVRWVLDPATGVPTSRVAANSLADLTQPHNRFAHVRVPAATLGFTNPPFNGFSSMPVLAVGSQLPHFEYALRFVDRVTVTDFCPSLTNYFRTPPNPPFQAFNGFLRPEFALGMDLTHTEVPTNFWGRERLGEDILSASILGFDVQTFDQLALVANHPGPDGQPGSAGVGGVGAPNSDDLVVSPNDPLFFEIARAAGTLSVASRGAYVDLAYDRLPGGTVRNALLDLRPTAFSQNTTPPVPALDRGNRLQSQFSLWREVNAVTNFLPDEMLKSGKLLTDNRGRVRLFQPTYDTFTVDYETDGFHQRDLNGLFPATRQGTAWFFPHPSLTAFTDLGSDGLDFSPGQIQYGNVGTDDPSEQETTAPFAAPASAIRVRLRIIDENSGTTTQQAVTSNSDF
ncbi:PulJ/GspJ family protein [Planctomycetaceae bacterium SH139]